jgi:glutathione S-transferase
MRWKALWCAPLVAQIDEMPRLQSPTSNLDRLIVAITFYYGSGSPYAWLVWLALEHKRLAYEQKILSFAKAETKAADYLALNPRGRVPVIVDDGFALYESSAIVEYLEDAYPNQGGKLFPGSTRQRAVVRRKISEAVSYFGPAMAKLSGMLFFSPAERWDATAIATARDATLKELERVEAELSGEFLAGELSAADFTFYPHLALGIRCDLKKSDLNFMPALPPKVAAWAARMMALAVVQKTWPPHWRT